MRYSFVCLNPTELRDHLAPITLDEGDLANAHSAISSIVCMRGEDRVSPVLDVLQRDTTRHDGYVSWLREPERWLLFCLVFSWFYSNSLGLRLRLRHGTTRHESHRNQDRDVMQMQKQKQKQKRNFMTTQIQFNSIQIRVKKNSTLFYSRSCFSFFLCLLLIPYHVRIHVHVLVLFVRYVSM